MKLRPAITILDRMGRAIAMLALLALVTVVAWDVAGRTFFDAPLGFAFELAGVLLGIALYCGLIGTNWRRSHLDIELFQPIFNRYPRFDAMRDRVSLILELAFFGIVAAMILRQALTTMRWGERFYFLPLEKWQPMIIFAGLAAIAAAILLLRFTSARPEDAK